MRIDSPLLEWAPNLLRRGSEYYWLLSLDAQQDERNRASMKSLTSKPQRLLAPNSSPLRLLLPEARGSLF